MNKLNSNITGVIMAGGESSRMGTDKGLINFNGRPMVEYAIDLLSGIFEKVIISANNNAYEQFGFEVVPDKYKNCGPIGGLHTVLSTIKTDYVFILSCDMPFMNDSTISEIIDLANENEIVASKLNRKIQPLCALYSKKLLPEIEKRILDKNYRMYDLINSSVTSFIKFDDTKSFVNINSHLDLTQHS